VITTERPGFGASSRLLGRGFAEPADDVAALLDHLGLDRVFLIGASGAAPHMLALAARHPDRIRAMTVLVGAAPKTADEASGSVGINAEAYRLLQSDQLQGFYELLEQVRTSILADPLAAFRNVMDRAPESDRMVMNDPEWQVGWSTSIREALRPGVDGWFDEGVALEKRWDEVDCAAVATSVTWYHAMGDANAPLSAAHRLIERLPQTKLVLFGDDEGHLAPYHREAEILDELLGRD
jgi:pimeloyl-ACP methyl ester carboxylesterase